MNQVNRAAGFEGADVQFIRKTSPIWYRALPPVIRGASSGSTVRTQHILSRLSSNSYPNTTREIFSSAEFEVLRKFALTYYHHVCMSRHGWKRGSFSGHLATIPSRASQVDGLQHHRSLRRIVNLKTKHDRLLGFPANQSASPTEHSHSRSLRARGTSAP